MVTSGGYEGDRVHNAWLRSSANDSRGVDGWVVEEGDGRGVQVAP